MLAGRRAFEGSTVTDVLAAVVRGEPDWSLLPADTPAGVRLLLRRCLQKDRSRRLHHIADVRIELEDAASDRTPVPGAPVGRANAKWAWLVAGGALAAVAGLSFVRLTGRDAPVEAPEMRVDVATPSLSNAIVLALSPDGQQVVFNASDGEPRLWLRSLGTTVARPLKGTDSARSPFWSPDGRYIGFFSEGKLKRLDVAGGLVQTLADAPFGAGGSWNNDGVVVFAPSVLGGLFRITKVGDAPEALTAAVSPLAHHSPQFLPDGRHFIFHVRGSNSERGVYVGSLDGTEPRKLVEGETAGVVTKSGHLLFVRQRTLFAQPLDMDGLKLTGQPVAVADEVAVDTFAGIAAVAASAAGPFAYRRGGTSSQQLIWYDRAGKQLGTAGQIDRAGMFNPDLSPDGGTVAISRAAESNQDVWQLDVVRGIQSRVTLDDASDQVPVWSPDGRQIVFSSNRKGTFDLYRKTVASSSPEELLMASPENKFAMGFSTDGKYLMYRATMPGVNWDLLALPLDGATRTPVPVAQTTFQEMIGEFSPDGRWVAYQSNESGSYEVYIQSFPTASVRMQVSTRGGSQPRWRRDGRELFYIGLDNRLMAVSFSIDAAGRPQASAPIALFPTRTAGGAVPNLQKQQFAVTKDGRFLINASVESGSESPITLVLNWRPPGSR
jgi:Tol biopolymer transport system component